MVRYLRDVDIIICNETLCLTLPPYHTKKGVSWFYLVDYRTKNISIWSLCTLYCIFLSSRPRLFFPSYAMKSIREGTLRLVAVASLIPFLVTAIGDLTESGSFNVDGLIKVRVPLTSPFLNVFSELLFAFGVPVATLRWPCSFWSDDLFDTLKSSPFLLQSTRRGSLFYFNWFDYKSQSNKS